MTGPEVTRASRARHRGAEPVDTELEELVGSDVIDVEVEPVGRPLLRFTVAATVCVLAATFIVVVLALAFELWGGPFFLLSWIVRGSLRQ